MMDMQLLSKAGRTAFPIRFAAEALGAMVSRDGATCTAVIIPPIVKNVIGAADIDRFRIYKYSDSVKSPLGSLPAKQRFGEPYCRNVHPFRSFPHQRFITDQQLIWQGSSLYYVRVFLQTDNGDKTLTEQDMEYGLV